MSKFEKSMEDIFDVAPKVIEIVSHETLPEVIKPAPVDGPDLTGDLNDAYDQTRANLQDVIDQGKEAMDEMLRISRESENPRAFEVYATLMKGVVDANKELLSIQKQMRTMDPKSTGGGGTTIDKAIFVGSTSELSKFLKSNK
jgi:hypothetical protein